MSVRDHCGLYEKAKQDAEHNDSVSLVAMIVISSQRIQVVSTSWGLLER